MSNKKGSQPLSRRKTGESLTTEKLAEGLRSRIDFQRTSAEKFADFLTRSLGTVSFLALNAVFFFVWISLNTGLAPGVEPFDPFPFGLLTMIVSLVAIFLSIIVLISQNRQSRNADIRQMMDFEIDVRSEAEITKILMMIDEIHSHLGIKQKHDSEFKEMTREIDLAGIKKEVEKEEEE